MCFLIGVFMMGVQTKDYSFRITTEHARQLLIVWHLCNFCGLFVLQGLRVTLITIVAYRLALQIKQQQKVLEQSRWYYIAPKEAVDVLLDALWTIELSQSNIPALKLDYS